MKRILLILALLGIAALTGCSNFAQPFGNIEPDVKTRPLSVILEPCNAAPGDTVTVTAYVYTPEPSISFTWTATLDYFETGFGVSVGGGRRVDMADAEIPGSMTTSPPDADGLVTHRFQFRVPDDALAASTVLPPVVDVTGYDSTARAMLGIPAGIDVISNAVFDSLLGANAIDLRMLGGMVPAEFELGIDTYTSGMLLEATVQCEVGLVVERTLAVSYSGRYHTTNANTNPVIGDISVISMDEDEEITNLDDLAGVMYDSILLYSAATPVTVPESILIDIDKKYYLVYTHDTEQSFNYISVNDASVQTGDEVYDNDWCYSNLDPTGSIQDSLLVIADSRLIPPRDTDMHNFRIYLLMHDSRAEWGATQGIGTAFAEVYGYFKYSDAYKAEH